jgi:hypothetical protein
MGYQDVANIISSILDLRCAKPAFEAGFFFTKSGNHLRGGEDLVFITGKNTLESILLEDLMKQHLL